MEIDNDNDIDGDAEGMPTSGKLAWESLSIWQGGMLHVLCLPG